MRRQRVVATVLAALAAGVVLIGSAYAAGLGRSGTASGLKPEKGVQWAHVDSDGTLLQHSRDVVSAARDSGTQYYTVTLSKDVSGCARTITLEGQPAMSALQTPAPAPTDVVVRIFYPSYGDLPDAFYLVVNC